MPPPIQPFAGTENAAESASNANQQSSQMNASHNSFTGHLSQMAVFTRHHLPNTVDMSGCSETSYAPSSYAAMYNRVFDSPRAVDVGHRLPNSIAPAADYFAEFSPMANVRFSTSTNNQLATLRAQVPASFHVPPPFHMLPPTHEPPSRNLTVSQHQQPVYHSPFSPQLPFNPLIPPPIPCIPPLPPPGSTSALRMPPYAYNSSVTSASPTSASFSYSVPLPVNFSVPPPINSQCTASVHQVSQAAYLQEMQSKSINVSTSSQTAGLLNLAWSCGTSVAAGIGALQNSINSVTALQSMSTSHIQFTTFQSTPDHQRLADLNFCAAANTSSIEETKSKQPDDKETMQQKADIDWVNCLASRVREKSSKVPSIKQSMTMVEFRSLLKEVILLNNQLKENKKQSEVSMTDEKENVECCESNSHSITPLSHVLRYENTLCPHHQKVHHLADGNIECISHSTGESEMDQLVLNSNPAPADSQEAVKFCSHNCTAVQMRIREIQQLLNEALDGIRKKQQRISNKRKRLKRQRFERYQAEQEVVAKRTKLLEELRKWEKEEQLKQAAIKMEADMKKAADKTLLEVRKKISDAQQSLKLLTQLRKLRNLRKDQAERKGIPTRKPADDIFDERLNAQTTLMKQQLELYEAEQRTLQVMLETEQEETKERERAQLERKEDERLKKYEQQLNEWLFGVQELIAADHPMMPYRQYYDLANYSVEALVNIRKEWDVYIVPEGTSGGSVVPYSWVMPSEPTDDIWASALNKR